MISDSTGAVIDTHTYSPFGQSGEGDGGFPFRFTGQKLDPETGLYYYKARYYDPELGRFLQTDPIGYADQMNLYAYVGNDPVNATDPTGMVECPEQGCESVQEVRQEIGKDLMSQETDDYNREYGGFIYQTENGNYNYTIEEGEADYIELGAPGDLEVAHTRVLEGWHSQPGVFGEAAEYFSLPIAFDDGGNPIYDTQDGDVAWSAYYRTKLSLFAPSGNISVVVPASGLMSVVNFVPPNQPTAVMPDGTELRPVPIQGIRATPVPAGRWRD